MIGIVPDSVRTRPSKGSPAAAFIRALQLQKSSIDILLKGGRAGSLGFIDVHKLEEHLNQLRHGVTEGIPEITRALSLEVWLQNLDSFRRNRRIIRETSQIRMERR
jgi:hypothetical protein